MRVTNYSPTKTGKKNSVLAFSCAKCGHIMVVKTGKSVTSFKSLSAIAKPLVTVCPACGTDVTIREKHSIFGSLLTHPNAADELADKLNQEQQEAVEKELNTLMDKVKKPEDLPESNPQAMIIRSDVTQLKQYLDAIIQLETNSRFLIVKVTMLYRRRTEAFRKAVDAQLDALDKSQRASKATEKKAQDLQQEIEQLKKAFSATNWEKCSKARKTPAPKEPEYYDVTPPAEPRYPVLKKPGADGVTYPNEPAYPTLKTPGFFNKKKIQEENAQLIAQYEAAIVAYRQACEKENAQLLAKYEADMAAYRQALEEVELVKQKNEALKQAYQAKLQKYQESAALRQEKAAEEALQKKEAARLELEEKISAIRQQIDTLTDTTQAPQLRLHFGLLFEQEIESAKQQLKLVTAEKNRLYSLNVLYPTYRELAAEASFYEYFSSGRCETLDGSHGAYNLFEAECRSDVAARMIRTLEEVKQGQVILQRQIKEITELITDVDLALEKAMPHMQKIEEDRFADYLDKHRRKGIASAATEKPDSKETAVDKYFRLSAACDRRISTGIALSKVFPSS